MAKTKLELKLPVDGGEVVFEAEKESGGVWAIKRTGVATFLATFESFLKMTQQTQIFVEAVSKLG